MVNHRGSLDPAGIWRFIWQAWARRFQSYCPPERGTPSYTELSATG